jgi:hypothetical protein
MRYSASEKFEIIELAEQSSLSIRRLLGYDPARNAPASIPRRIARVIILPGVDHDRSAARMKN